MFIPPEWKASFENKEYKAWAAEETRRPAPVDICEHKWNFFFQTSPSILHETPDFYEPEDGRICVKCGLVMQIGWVFHTRAVPVLP